jgi:hypothetical protein
MTQEQEQIILGSETIYSVVQAGDLISQKDRTLLYGYTCERDTWHVYLKDGVIYCCVYPYKQSPKQFTPKTNSGYIPDKRLYPAMCDFEFCMLLKQNGVSSFPFTTFQEVPLKGTYYGETL